LCAFFNWGVKPVRDSLIGSNTQLKRWVGAYLGGGEASGIEAGGEKIVPKFKGSSDGGRFIIFSTIEASDIEPETKCWKN